jgi:hypothetical protein
VEEALGAAAHERSHGEGPSLPDYQEMSREAAARVIAAAAQK